MNGINGQSIPRKMTNNDGIVKVLHHDSSNTKQVINDKYKPVASDESKDDNIFWIDDPCDDMLPTDKGFLSDLIYYTRGREVPSIFVIWAGLYCMASVVKREAWFGWADKKLFPNIYSMIIAPAGAAKKNTAIDLTIDLLDFIDDEIQDHNVKRMKMINPFMSKATPEKLITCMMPDKKRGTDFFLTDEHGNKIIVDDKPVEYKIGSEIAISQHEMSTLIGKQNYMEGLLEHLLNWYDCHPKWSYETHTRGSEDLINLYVTFIGAATPATLKSLPPQVVGDGFLSRTMLVYQAFTDRIYDEPIIPNQAPRIPELRKRLAWIAENTLGEFKYSPEAKAYRKITYYKFKKQLAIDGAYQGVRSRLDVIINKVAMLVSWQKYSRNDNNEISLDDLFDAEYLVMRTFEESVPMYNHIINENNSEHNVKISDMIKRYKVISRETLLRKSHVKAEVINEELDNLYTQGKIFLYDPIDKVKLTKLRNKSTDVYIWLDSDTQVVKGTRELYGLTDKVVAYYNKYSIPQIEKRNGNCPAEEQEIINIMYRTTENNNVLSDKNIIDRIEAILKRRQVHEALRSKKAAMLREASEHIEIDTVIEDIPASDMLDYINSDVFLPRIKEVNDDE